MSTPEGPLQIEAAERPIDWWHKAVREQERRGELLAAFDLAERALAEYSTDTWLKHRAVLALVRAGATEEAERRFFEYGLQDIAEEDVAALLARIAKDDFHGVIRIWPACDGCTNVKALMQQARRRITRQLTAAERSEFIK